MPITVTERAAREVAAVLASQDKAGATLRVWVAGSGCSGLRYGLGIDEKDPEKDDQVFESNGVRVVVDPQSLSFLDGSTVSWVEDAENSGFSIENPNPPPSTGCGCDDAAGCGSGCGEPEQAPSEGSGEKPAGRRRGGSCCGGD
jgi:iron-sulfur cluster assembly protein